MGFETEIHPVLLIFLLLLIPSLNNLTFDHSYKSEAKDGYNDQYFTQRFYGPLTPLQV